MTVAVVEYTAEGWCAQCAARLGQTTDCSNCQTVREVWGLAEPRIIEREITMERGAYLDTLGDLLNRDPAPWERATRVREANQRLYQTWVKPEATAVEAHLALAEAAEKERRH